MSGRRSGPAASPERVDVGELKRVLRQLIEETTGIPAQEIHDDSALDDDLVLDSMSFVSLQVAVEATLGISCAPEEIEAANRFDAIAALVAERVGARRGNGVTRRRAGSRATGR
jgi:acyl carrier protein